METPESCNETAPRSARIPWRFRNLDVSHARREGGAVNSAKSNSMNSSRKRALRMAGGLLPA